VSDWQKQIYPQFWDISIKKDTNSYIDFSWQMLLIHRIQSPDIRLKKYSSNKFDFTLNFNKFCKWSEFGILVNKAWLQSSDLDSIRKTYSNNEFGTYRIQISYLKEYYDRKNSIIPESNTVCIDYRKQE
jgi:hypothetical protein